MSDPIGGAFEEFLDELGIRHETYEFALETLKREASPEQLAALRKLLASVPPWNLARSDA